MCSNKENRRFVSLLSGLCLVVVRVKSVPTVQATSQLDIRTGRALARKRSLSRCVCATGLGRHDEAIDRLERAYEQRAGAVYGIKGSFLFEALRTHPRFVALLRKMNLA
jgi:hypothetical protein